MTRTALLGSTSEGAYTIRHYAAMIEDQSRTDAYAEALARAVRTDSVVVDIGTGSGTFALLAARLGARRVFAIDPDDVIQLAKALAQANGLSERIAFIQDLSTAVELPERADVVVSDLHGALPLYDDHLATIVDARRRLLREGGLLIPTIETLRGALAAAPELYDQYLGIWSRRPYGLDHSPGRHMVASRRWMAWIEPEQLLTDPQSWRVLDYRVLEDPSVGADLEWEIGERGIAHGLCLWYDCTLLDGVGFSNAPGQPKGVYPHTFLPFEKPLELVARDEVRVRLRATYAGDDYIWRWSARVTAGEQVKAATDQSSFESRFLSSSRLKRGSVSHMPKLRPEGEAMRAALDLMDGARSIEEIAAELATRFPAQFEDSNEAVGVVAELSQRLSE
jgi:type I protein arginine methyltransferase